MSDALRLTALPGLPLVRAGDDLAALLAELEASGYQSTPENSIPGVRRAFVSDPFGNRLELRQA